MNSELTKETSRSGAHLLVRSWHPDDTADTVIVIVHGIGEHSGRYEHVGEYFADHGYEVQSYDHRGHGESSGKRLFIVEWGEYLLDLEDRLSAARIGGKKVVMYGHSLGGLIGLSYLVTKREALPDAAVLSAPSLDSNEPGWKKGAARVLGSLTPSLAVPLALKGDQLSRDPSVGEKYFADPLVNINATTRLGSEILGAQRDTLARLGSLTVPTMVIHGEADTIVPVEASEPLQGLPGVERKTYPGHRHELHNEPEWQDILGDVLDWIQANV